MVERKRETEAKKLNRMITYTEVGDMSYGRYIFRYDKEPIAQNVELRKSEKRFIELAVTQ